MQGVIVRIAVSVFGLLTVGMLLLAIYNDKGAVAVYASSLKLDAIQKDNKALEEENKKTLEEIQALKSEDPATIEREAREKQGLVKKNEIILVIPEDSAAPKN
jgi:cell division protein FtsB